MDNKLNLPFPIGERQVAVLDPSLIIYLFSGTTFNTYYFLFMPVTKTKSSLTSWNNTQQYNSNCFLYVINRCNLNFTKFLNKNTKYLKQHIYWKYGNLRNNTKVYGEIYFKVFSQLSTIQDVKIVNCNKKHPTQHISLIW